MMSECSHVFFSMYCGHSLLTWSIPQVFIECLAYARNIVLGNGNKEAKEVGNAPLTIGLIL